MKPPTRSASITAKPTAPTACSPIALALESFRGQIGVTTVGAASAVEQIEAFLEDPSFVCRCRILRGAVELAAQQPAGAPGVPPVAGGISELDQVDHVMYILDRTFHELVREVDNRATKFRLEAASWGEFAMHAKAILKSGGETVLHHNLRLLYPDGTPTAA